MRRYDLDSLENRDDALLARLAPVISAVLGRYFRAEVRGLGRIPAGAAMYVGNHSGGLSTPDSFVFGAKVFEELGPDAMPWGLGHEIAIGLPVLSQIVVPLGAVRASHENAHKLFEAGRKVLVYPGGDYDAFRPWRHRGRIVFGGRRGYVRLALRHGVPLVPVVSAGSHETFVVFDDLRWLARLLRADRWLRFKVWPLTLSFPWGLWLGPPPPFLPFPSRILVEVLDPIRFERAGPEAAADEAYVEACARRAEEAMQSALTRLEEERGGRP